MSDHDVVSFNINTKPHHQIKPPRRVYIYKKADNDKLKKETEEYAHEYLASDPLSRSVNTNWCEIKSKLTELLHKHVPSKTVGGKRHLPWIDSTIKRQMRKRDRLYTKAKKSHNRHTWAQYRMFRNKVTKSIRCAHHRYINEVVGGNLQENPKSFWSYVKLMRTENLGIPPLKYDGKMCTSDSEKANALNSHFKAVFHKEDLTSVPSKGSSKYPDINN
jgi:hypothetical protein